MGKTNTATCWNWKGTSYPPDSQGNGVKVLRECSGPRGRHVGSEHPSEDLGDSHSPKCRLHTRVGEFTPTVSCPTSRAGITQCFPVRRHSGGTNVRLLRGRL